MAFNSTPTTASNILSPHRARPNPSDPERITPNVSNVVLGNLHIKPHYPSFYPSDLVGGSGRKTDWLYVCQWCFKYTSEILKYSGHCKVCSAKDEEPPGEIVYAKGDIEIREVDGEEEKLWAQNLSLLSKLWLDTKSVFFDVGTFLYYPLILKSEASEEGYGQVVGFFSKEKMSWDNNNVACILILPPWQRRGLGQILIAASYALGRREGRFGGPERPLSAMGRKGYVSYWCGEVFRYLMKVPGKKTVGVQEISEGMYIAPEDVAVALREMGCWERRKSAGGSVVIKKGELRRWAQKMGVSEAPVVDEEAFFFEESRKEEDEESEEG